MLCSHYLIRRHSTRTSERNDYFLQQFFYISYTTFYKILWSKNKKLSLFWCSAGKMQREIFSNYSLRRNTIFLSRFLTFWLNAILAMVASPQTAFFLPQFTENPRTLTDIFTTRHITSNIRSSLLPKLYLAGLTLTSHKTHRTYAVLCD